MRSVREMAEEAGMYERDGETVVARYSPETLERLVAIVRAEVLEETLLVCQRAADDAASNAQLAGSVACVVVDHIDMIVNAIRALVKEK